MNINNKLMDSSIKAIVKKEIRIENKKKHKIRKKKNYKF